MKYSQLKRKALTLQSHSKLFWRIVKKKNIGNVISLKCLKTAWVGQYQLWGKDTWHLLAWVLPQSNEKQRNSWLSPINKEWEFYISWHKETDERGWCLSLLHSASLLQLFSQPKRLILVRCDVVTHQSPPFSLWGRKLNWDISAAHLFLGSHKPFHSRGVQGLKN